MQDQANSGEILIYAGQHGVDHTDDIGRLIKAEITPGGDWVITNRLYDEQDGFNPGSRTLEKANKLWNQIKGLPPYHKPRQYGYSIEGFIPDGGILQMSDTGKRVIDKVDLDGVLVTPRPAYTPSVIYAVYKALNELPPKKAEAYKANIQHTFAEMLEHEKREENFFTQKYKLEELFQKIIEEIMSQRDQIPDKLNLAFDQFKAAMIPLLTEHEDLFRQPLDQSNAGTVSVVKDKLRIYKNIHDQINQLKSLINLRGNKTKRSKDRGSNKLSNGAGRSNNH
jgi:hypothetical protein